MRVKIYAVLACVGFDKISGDLEIEDSVSFTVVEQYADFRFGQRWLDLKEDVAASGTVPISADALLMETRIEEAFNTAMTTRCVQKQLLTAGQRRDEGREGTLFNSILMQKEQEF